MATWHVRPTSYAFGTNAGTSYENAWQGWASVVWGVSGVNAGDTLIVHGAHAYSSTISVGAHGAANEGGRVTITGTSPNGDNSSITFSGASFLQNTRAWTTIKDLSIVAGTSNCIFVQASGTSSIYQNIAMTANSGVAFAFNNATGQAHSGVTITGCTFTGVASNSGAGAAIGWFLSATSALSTLTNITISDNTFDGFIAGRSVIHFRTEDDTDVGSVMTGITVSGNTFTNCAGIMLEANHGHNTYGIGGTITVNGNTAVGCTYGTGTSGSGGFASINGFTKAEVYENDINGIAGTAGFCNVFYATADIHDNVATNIESLTIDGNGVLFDLGCRNCVARNNTFVNIYTIGSNENCGVGVMILAATGCVAQGNTVNGCRWGVYIGAQGAGQSGKVVCNTFTGCTSGAIYAGATSALAGCDVRDNIFTGDGYTVRDLSAATWTGEDYNCFYGFATGASAHTLGTNSITTDPLLGTDYSIPATSPCKGAGVYIAGAKHFGGHSMSVVSPDIGARRYFADRAVTAR